jgi:hypothetical protein
MKRISIVLVLAALVFALVLTGCPPTTTSGSTTGTNGVNAPNIVATEAGIQAAYDDDYRTIYLVGDVTTTANLTIPAGMTLIVTTTGDIAARSSGSGTGKLTVGNGKTLIVNGIRQVGAARTFALGEGAGLIIDDAATLTLEAGAALDIDADLAYVAFDQATINGAGAAAYTSALSAAKTASPVQYTSTQGDLSSLFSNPGVTTVYYGNTTATGAINAPTKELVLTNTVANNAGDIVLKTLTVNPGAQYETATNTIVVDNLVNNGAVLVSSTGTITVNTAFTNTGTITSSGAAGAIAFGANVASAANAGTITLKAAAATVTAGHASAAFTNTGTIANTTAAWNADPFAAFTGTKVFTNNGTIETIATAAAVQKALIELAGTGTVKILGIGAGALGESGNITQVLNQNVDIGTSGKLIAPLEVTAFSTTGGKTITITDTGVLDFGIDDTLTTIGVTVTNNGTAPGAVVTTTISRAALSAILGIGGNITSNGAVSDSATALTIPVGTILTTGSTIGLGSGALTVTGTLNLGHILTTSGNVTVTAATGKLNVTADQTSLTGDITIDGEATLSSSGKLYTAAAKTITVGSAGKLVVNTNNGSIVGSLVVDGRLEVLTGGTGVLTVPSSKTLTVGVDGVIYVGDDGTDAHSVTLSGTSAFTAGTGDIDFTAHTSAPSIDLGTLTATPTFGKLVTTGGGYITTATVTAAVVDALFVTPGTVTVGQNEVQLTRKVTLTGDMSTSAVSGATPKVEAGVIVTAATGTFAEVDTLEIEAGGELLASSATFKAATVLTVNGTLDLTASLASTGASTGSGTIISRKASVTVVELQNMLKVDNVVLVNATAAMANDTVLTVKAGGHLYATDKEGAYFGPGAYKVESQTVTITPGTGSFTLLGASDDAGSLATELGSITLPEGKYILNSATAVKLGFGHADFASAKWAITTEDAAKLTATNGQVTIGPLAITGVATDDTANYASLVSSAVVVVYDVAAGANHAAPLVIDNVIVVLTSGDKLKMAVGGEIKLTGTTAATGSTKFAGGGGILLVSDGAGKLAVGNAVLAAVNADSSATTAVAGKIVGTNTITDTTSGITGSNGTFVTSVTTSNQFPLAAY